MKKISVILFLLTIPFQAQIMTPLTYGVKFGVNYTDIKEIPQTLIAETNNDNYSLVTDYTFGGLGGFFVNYKFNNTNMALQSELGYSMEHGKVNYEDKNDFKYTIEFKYDYVQLNTILKFYPFYGLNFGIGPQVGLNLDGGNILYKSNKEDIYGPDLQTQQVYKNNLKGKTNFQAVLSLGYEFDFGLTIDARYLQGIADIIETYPNTYRFLENKNTSSGFQFSVGYVFNADGRSPF